MKGVAITAPTFLSYAEQIMFQTTTETEETERSLGAPGLAAVHPLLETRRETGKHVPVQSRHGLFTRVDKVLRDATAWQCYLRPPDDGRNSSRSPTKNAQPQPVFAQQLQEQYHNDATVMLF